MTDQINLELSSSPARQSEVGEVPDPTEQSLVSVDLSKPEASKKSGPVSDSPKFNSNSTERAANWFYVIPVTSLAIVAIFTVIPFLGPFFDKYFLGNKRYAFIANGATDSIYYMIAFFCGPILGHLSDIVGRRLILGLASTVLVLPFVLTAATSSVPVYLVSRALSGLLAVNVPVALAYVSDVSSRESRAGRYGIVLACLCVSVIIGASSGGMLQWSVVRWFSIGLIVVIPIIAFVIPESLKQKKTLNRDMVIGCRTSMSRIKVLATGGITPYVTIMMCLEGFCEKGIQSTMMYYLTAKFGWDQRKIGTWLAVGAASCAVYSGMLKIFVRYTSEVSVILAALLLSATSTLLYFLADEGHWFYPIVLLYSVQYVVRPAACCLISKECRDAEQGTALASAHACRELISSFGPFIFGAISGIMSSKSDELLKSVHFLLATFCYLIGFVVMFVFRSKAKVRENGGCKVFEC
eukprot:689464_1